MRKQTKRNTPAPETPEPEVSTPGWETNTPNPPEDVPTVYELVMWVNDFGEQAVYMTRAEYIALKEHLAALRDAPAPAASAAARASAGTEPADLITQAELRAIVAANDAAWDGAWDLRRRIDAGAEVEPGDVVLEAEAEPGCYEREELAYGYGQADCNITIRLAADRKPKTAAGANAPATGPAVPAFRHSNAESFLEHIHTMQNLRTYWTPEIEKEFHRMLDRGHWFIEYVYLMVGSSIDARKTRERPVTPSYAAEILQQFEEYAQAMPGISGEAA